MSRSRTPNRSLGAVAALGIALVSMLAAAVLLALRFAYRVLTPQRRPSEDVTVWALEHRQPGPDLIWLSGPDIGFRGNYSLLFDDDAGHVRVGAEVDRVHDGRALRVAREIIEVERGDVRPGARGRISGWWFSSPEQLDLDVEHIRIPLEGGYGSAWLISPPAPVDGRWAVHVHGRGARREEVLRGVAPLARAGVTSLVITYRNDPEAPRGLRGRYGMGAAERRDVDAAIAWAREHGAKRITLVGWSMGGTACVLAATRGPQRAVIDGIVLDSPALDWPGILRQQARLARVPGWVASLGQRLLENGRIRGAVPGERGTPIGALVPSSLAEGLTVPVLIHASPEDTFVPWRGAHEFADLRPDLVTLRVAHGEHVKLWNVDPEGWERETEAFVRALPAPARVN